MPIPFERRAVTPAPTPSPPVRHEAATQRFITELDGLPGEIDYELADGVMRLMHTTVDPGLQGRGVGATLVAAAMAHAEQAHWRVDVQCSYARGWLQRHPEWSHLLV